MSYCTDDGFILTAPFISPQRKPVGCYICIITQYNPSLKEKKCVIIIHVTFKFTTVRAFYVTTNKTE